MICLTILALAISCTSACDPDDNNKPTCNTRNVNVPVRNFFDPTSYWLCSSADGEAQEVRCPDGELYEVNAGKCIDISEWKWTPYCNEEESN